MIKALATPARARCKVGCGSGRINSFSWRWWCWCWYWWCFRFAPRLSYHLLLHACTLSHAMLMGTLARRSRQHTVSHPLFQSTQIHKCVPGTVPYIPVPGTGYTFVYRVHRKCFCVLFYIFVSSCRRGYPGTISTKGRLRILRSLSRRHPERPIDVTF